MKFWHKNFILHVGEELDKKMFYIKYNQLYTVNTNIPPGKQNMLDCLNCLKLNLYKTIVHFNILILP